MADTILSSEEKAEILINQELVKKTISTDHGYADYIIIAVHKSNEVSLVHAQESNPGRLHNWLVGTLSHKTSAELLTYLKKVVEDAEAVIKNGG